MITAIKVKRHIRRKVVPIVVLPTDIVFECPCGKSMVTDESGIGKMVECPKCKVWVIVPPRPVLNPYAEAKRLTANFRQQLQSLCDSYDEASRRMLMLLRT